MAKRLLRAVPLGGCAEATGRPQEPCASHQPPGDVHPGGKCWISSTPNSPCNPKVLRSGSNEGVQAERYCGSPYWIRPKVSKTKITNIK